MKKSLKKYVVQIVIALVLSVIFMDFRGAFDSEAEAAERLMGVCDGFSMTAMLYVCFGCLLWVSTTGFFDIFSYALRKGAHAIIPGMGFDNLGSYYDYKQDKAAQRNTKPEYSTLFIGLGFLALSALLVVVWYAVA